MNGDCVFDAWKEYASFLGVKTNFTDRLKFWDTRLSLSRMTVWPGQMTPLKYVPDIIADLSFNKMLYVDRMELDVYRVEDLNPSPMVRFYTRRGIFRDTHNITEGIFCSLNSRHAYFAREYDGNDWIALAIHIRNWR